MLINVSGTRGKKLDVLTKAVEFFALQLMDKRMVKNLTIDVEVSKNTDFMGQCVNEDGTKRSRWFTIELRDQSLDEMIKTLAHEMVHVKQHAKNELSSGHMVVCRGGLKMVSKWNGVDWNPKKNEDPYYDAPWEIEAFGREVGLAYKFYRLMEN